MDTIGLAVFQIAILAIMIFGLVGLATTIIPGLTVIWAAALVYALVTGFNLLSGILFGGMTVLMIGGNLVDNYFMGASARKTGASWLSIGVALTAGVAGSIIWPPFGGLILALLGLFLVEFIRLRNWRQALTSTRSMATGCGWAVFTRLGIGMVMILMWLVWIYSW
ncbi:MAG: DUF456 family protein [Anaerolineaceae bacterium]